MNPGTTMTKSSNRRKIGAVTMRCRIRRCHRPEENETMTGIQYVTDEKGRKVAVQIDLTKHRELWQDLQDVLVSRSRRHEKRIPLNKVKAGLIKSGKLPRD
jgi:hypothetical protein